MYDPVYHKRVDDAEDNDIYTSVPAFDQRWYRIRRPFIISGGELTLDSLDLGYSDALGYYTAPLQLKANNGIYVIDDLGRQRVTAREVLNRWIVPMEQGVDFLSFRSGSKISLPFAAFLIFSTNLNPGDISDEAFLRRIQYKLLIRDPDAEEFTTIFRRCCDSLKLDCPEEILEDFLQGHYAKTGKPMRRCHPRDILEHAVNLIEFRELPYQLTGEILDEAFDSCFLEDLH
jgi:predicted ATPase with chaperone activity